MGIVKNVWYKVSFDKQLFLLIATLVLFGFLIFLSAALGLQAREQLNFASIVTNQLIFGLFGGLIAFTLAVKIPYKTWAKYSVVLFIIGLLATLAVFIPGIGFSYGGATRWIDIGILTFQPAEILKITTVFLAASWLSHLKHKTDSWKFGFLPILLLIGLVSIVLLLQPDTGTVVIISASLLTCFIVSGAKWRQVLSIILIGIVIVSMLAIAKPYIKQRLLTFIDPTSDPLGAGYQTQQSLIAVGSGKIFGRGPGQSIQKFNYLPEPINDSIFAVYAEEWGFAGSIFLIILFSLFSLKAYQVSSKAKTRFGVYLGTGLTTIIITQSFFNIGSMIGIFPLSGMPLIFVSHGGTALALSLFSAGILINISKDLPKKDRQLKF